MLEAALLFWIGRTKNVSFYEYISYAMMVLALVSLCDDWDNYSLSLYSKPTEHILPFFNPIFLTAVIAICAYGFINWIAQKREYYSEIKDNSIIMNVSTYVLPTTLVGIIYLAFYKEIGYYFDLQSYDSILYNADDTPGSTGIMRNYSYRHFKYIWLFNYTMVFLSALFYIINTYVSKRIAHLIVLGISFLVMIGFLTAGLYSISELRTDYLDVAQAEYYHRGTYFIWIRYISISIFGMLLYLSSREVVRYYYVDIVKLCTEVFIALVALQLLSSELIHWIDITGNLQEYGMGLSILWGLFSLLVVSFGIWRKKKHLRILGIAVFGVTLVKLFFYDLASLSSISKTIVLISLGILLLGTSFLYNKYTVDEE